MCARRIQPLFLVLCLGALLLLAASAQASVPHVDGDGAVLSLDQPSYTAHENQGSLTITITRTGNLDSVEHVGYGVKQQDAQNGIDFDVVPNSWAVFQPQQTTATVSVPIIDLGINGTPVHALAYLYSAWPGTLGTNTNSLVTILHDDPIALRAAANPLGLPSVVNGNPLAGAKLFVNPQAPAAVAAQHASGSAQSLLNVIASEPGASRFYMWNMGGNVAGQVSHFLEMTQQEQPGTTVMLSSYNLVHDGCGYSATPAIESRYDHYMDDMAAGIGNFPVVYFLEFDSLITTPCLSHAQLAIREAELRYAVSALERDPHVLVYLDGGAADAISANRMAALLRASGVGQAQGFFLNSTHFDWTTREIHYGQQISRLLGGAHFIVNTGENGRGPLVPHNRVKHGNEVLCNPPGRGLGPLSVSGGVAQQTGYAGLDGLLWFSNPGGSGGHCVRGAPPTGTYWPAYAEGLARNRSTVVNGPKQPLQRLR